MTVFVLQSISNRIERIADQASSEVPYVTMPKRGHCDNHDFFTKN